MRLSGGVETALHCCFVLAHAEGPVAVSRLAEYHDVSPTYLAKQLQALARAGLVTAVTGPSGGYRLSRTPDRIAVLDVVVAVEGPEPAFRCAEIRQNGPLAVPPEQCLRPCAIARAMARAEDAYRAALAATTIADLVADIEGDASSPGMPRLRRWLAGDGP